MKQIVRVKSVLEALGGGAVKYRNGLNPDKWLVIKKADYENLLKLLSDTQQALRPMHHLILKQLSAGNALPIQDLIQQSGAGHGSINSALQVLMKRGVIVRKRFHDPNWPIHANIGRWLYSLKDQP